MLEPLSTHHNVSTLVDLSRLRDLLGPLAVRFDVDALAHCDSTNTQLQSRAEQGAGSGTVIVADRQMAGRGRRGRQWHSAPQDSLTFSLLWRFTPEAVRAGRLAGLSLAVGVAVAEALEDIGIADVALKWPNDILRGNGKLGGILVELSSARAGTAAVIGIGLNLRLPDGATQLAGQRVAALESGDGGVGAEDAAAPDRHQVLAALLRQLAARLDLLAVAGFEPLRPAWQARHAWQGRPVCLLAEGAVIASGLCLGADDDGALLVDSPQGPQRYLSGDLSLREET